MIYSLLLTFALAPQEAKPLPSLLVGMKAPPLAIDTWLKGEPVTKMDAGHVYLIEFWATWCGPCMNGMSHLSELQKKYTDKGLVVISIAAPDDYGNNLPNIQKTVDANATRIDYRIAFDQKTEKGYQGVFKGKTIWDYMGAAQVMAIPTSFLIDRQGRIASIGLPSVVEGTLQKVLEGSFDIGEAAKAYAEFKGQEDRIRDYGKLMKDRKYDEAYALAKQLVDGPFRNDARMQWLIADYIVGDLKDKEIKRDLALAKGCAEMAVEASGGSDLDMKKTLACVYFHLGKREEALSIMRDLVSRAAGDGKKSMEGVLAQMMAAS